MLLTNCAACAAPLPRLAKQCSRCQTRYCNATCQTDHWRRGHKQICKKIHRGGGAEQYHADKKYKEAVAVAVERLFIGLMHTYYLSLWLYHFYGHEGYRKDLRVAVKGLLHLAQRAQDAKQKSHIERLLRTLLTHQLDWSLDDLELDSTERQIVDRLADLPAASYCMNEVHCMRYIISSAGF